MEQKDHEGFWLTSRQKGPAVRGNVIVPNRRIKTFVAWFSTILAAMMLIGAIISLYVV
jgi:hypothetical protein